MTLSLKEFGKYIRRLRDNGGILQKDVSAGTGISKGYLSQIEQGSLRNMPSEDIICALADFHGVDSVGMLIDVGIMPMDYMDVFFRGMKKCQLTLAEFEEIMIADYTESD